MAPEERSRCIIGVPYEFESLTGSPITLRMAHDPSELKMERELPTNSVNCTGRGKRKTRNAIGKINGFKVRALKIMRMVPATKRGREAMWYSRG